MNSLGWRSRAAGTLPQDRAGQNKVKTLNQPGFIKLFQVSPSNDIILSEIVAPPIPANLLPI
jgi:hypothetical protein